jgi:predicted unusual protein kinase regulating ubiquinone biosynthesis (AarF/ABC1/UbiB family)
MEWIEGEKLKPWSAYTIDQRRKLIEVVRTFHRESAARTNLFRYDNHWSNFIITPAGKLAILDFGTVIDLTEARKNTIDIQFARNTISSEQLTIAAYEWVEHYLTLISSQGFYT